ncbi:putative zinc transport system zinc-binding lipoprotein AdcA precursor [Kiritimatiella glycovorans]|uniref:Putative zinc transport system zinc-binding lipoprotein AdcA n=2 Tax=Kiritimatiella glycovorans TaxID=1307763 RepID=A0A0G3EFK6_9BACT|nr:putative zinc transport system zinc-binding lipoprotein AdcA precursor [Kiritimatiella glycovorans]
MCSRFIFTLGAAAGLVFSACADPDPAVLRVQTSIPPLKTFVERVGGDGVEAATVLRAGESPAVYRPRPREVAALLKADLFFRVGVPFEDALLPRIRTARGGPEVVDLRRGLKLRRMPEAHRHDGHDQHSHDHGRSDPHVWLDPDRVRIMARTIRDTLIRRDPGREKEYRRRCDLFIDELDRLDERIGTMLAPYEGRTFYVVHPSFGYFAEAYELEQAAIEPGGKAPGPAHLRSWIRRAREERIGAVLVQPQFPQNAARAIAEEAGARLIEVDPLDPDYGRNLLRMAESLKEALE